MPREVVGVSLSKTVYKALQYLGSVRNYAPTTIETLEVASGQFQDFIRARDLPNDLRQFNADNLVKFAESLAAKQYKASTIAHRLSSLSTIARMLMKLQDDRGKPYLSQNPTKTFEWPTPDASETKFLLPAELAAFLAVPRPLRESIARDILIDTGMRCSELCRAKVGDVITVEGKTALAVTVKGRGRRLRKRHVPVSAEVATGLYEYLLSRGIASPQDPAHSNEPLVMARDGRAWKRTALSGLMARIGREAGVTRLRTSAHKLRHTASVVTRLARLPDGSRLDSWTRSQLLSHSSPASLDRYEHLLPDELFQAREAHRAGLARYLGEDDTTPSRPARGRQESP